jgi:predicted NAD/FAD-binding protein
MKIAIIGAGVSGLSAAYYLYEAAEQHHKPTPEITIFEKESAIGGAAQTFPLKIGDIARWADMGVNDFNTVTYTELTPLLDKLGVKYHLLSDTTSYYTLDNTFSYTIDGKWGTAMPKALRDEYDRFQEEAPDHSKKSHYRDYTVERYLEEKNYSKDFARYNLYPRINGMYFSHETSPALMPFRGVMHYYILQEGFGTQEPPQRMYFAEGSGKWIDALNVYVQSKGAKFFGSTSTQVAAGSSGVMLQTPQGSQHYDVCVMACHANAALKVLNSGVTQDMVNVLSKFEYCNSIAVAHTFAPLLPHDKSAWRTYNILIHDYYEQLRPYTISYVVNWHQNDALNSQYNNFEDPNYFVTLNPSVPIPDRYVLPIAGGVRQPAIAYFPHNVVSLDAMDAQEQLKHVQSQNHVFFVGGWTNGAGLQQECLLMSKAVAKHIITGVPHYEDTYNSHPDAEHFAPAYLRNVLK